MNQKKTGVLLKNLRKEKNLSQAELAEKLGVSNRSISRWENGMTMPDFDLLIEVADFYEVDVREILDGERRGVSMDTQHKEELLQVADYTNQEKKRMTRVVRWLFLYGLLALTTNMVLEEIGIRCWCYQIYKPIDNIVADSATTRGLVTGSCFLGCTALRCRGNLRKCQDFSSSHFLRFCYAAMR